MDRPSRKTKTVNYCETKDFDDDEDFACVKAPPSKKVREDVKQEQKKSLSKSSSQEATTHSSQKNRQPLDEKLCERDLEAAITLSMLNNVDEVKDQSPVSKGHVQFPVDENTDPASLLLSNCSVDGAIMGLDKITSEKGWPAPARQRKAASKATEELINKDGGDDDDDYQPKLTPDSESDEDFSEPSESEDEEFTVKKVSKTKKKEKATKSEKNKQTPASKKEKQPSKPSKPKSQAAAPSTPVTTPPTTKPASKRPASSSTVCTSKPAASLSPAAGRMPKWNPPAQIGKSPSTSQTSAMKSPSQGLRLGLSRLVRVKPLHPSVSSH